MIASLPLQIDDTVVMQRFRRYRRHEVRQTTSRPVYYGPKVPDELGFLKNVTPSGLCIRGMHGYPDGTRLTIMIPSSGKDSLVITGSIIWTRDLPVDESGARVDVGIRIISGADEYLQLIDDLGAEQPERRRHRRLEDHRKVLFLEPRSRVPAQLQNVSEGGLFVLGRYEYEVGATMVLELSLPRELPPIRPEVAVRHVITPEDAVRREQDHGMGLKLVDILPNEERVWRQYLSWLEETAGLLAHGVLGFVDELVD